jgi:DNA-binding MarR family transcriptional regulator
LRQCDIAAYHHIEWPSANGLLLRLERRDLIERRCDSADRRAKRIRITEMGRQVLSEMSCEIARIEDVALADIDGAIRSQLQSFFKAFWGNLASSTIDPLLRNGNSLIQMRICSERNESGADHQ